MVMIIAMVTGCATQRGVDFGHWSGAAEPVPVMRIYNEDDGAALTGEEKILVLPTLGSYDDPVLQRINGQLTEEMRRYFPVDLFEIDSGGPLSDYVNEKNLSPTTTEFDIREIARLGRLLGATHVLCSRLRNARFYAPQNLDLYFLLVDVEKDEAVLEMDAAFDASDQEVVIALDSYLQRRVARKYDRNNLNVMLNSPTEYGAFVSAQCTQALEETLWPSL
jgi:hypothetical protein